MIRLYLHTSSPHKIAEIESILGDVMDVVPLYSIYKENIDIEEVGTTFEGNAMLKASGVWNILKDKNIDLKDSVILSEDSGISIDALNGAPGVYSARFARLDASFTPSKIEGNSDDIDNLNRAIDELKSRNITHSDAEFVSCVAIYGENISKIFEGKIKGKVITTPKGKHGFGYDPIFVPNGYDKTMAELESNIKNKISHRKIALEKMRDFIKNM